MDWERMIPGHPGEPGGRLGTKKDAQDVLDADAGSLGRRSRSSAQDGKCWEPVEKEFKLPKYATLPGYEAACRWSPGAIAALGPRHLSLTARSDRNWCRRADRRHLFSGGPAVSV